MRQLRLPLCVVPGFVDKLWTRPTCPAPQCAVRASVRFIVGSARTVGEELIHQNDLGALALSDRMKQHLFSPQIRPEHRRTRNSNAAPEWPSLLASTRRDGTRSRASSLAEPHPRFQPSRCSRADLASKPSNRSTSVRSRSGTSLLQLDPRRVRNCIPDFDNGFTTGCAAILTSAAEDLS